jgi:hypothetical protein
VKVKDVSQKYLDDVGRTYVKQDGEIEDFIGDSF